MKINLNLNQERGNVLFLILIAVALFAALSYAVTSSSRTGGGTASKEKLQMAHSTLQSYVSGMRATITRMVLNGTSINDINFYDPTSFGGMTQARRSANVFHPQGGNFPFQKLYDGQLLFGGIAIRFIFGYQIENLGSTTASTAGNEILFALPVEESLCLYINQRQLQYNDIGYTANFRDDGFNSYYLGNAPNAWVTLVANNGLPSNYIGQPEGCVYDDDRGEYYYYAAIVER